MKDEVTSILSAIEQGDPQLVFDSIQSQPIAV